MFDAQILDVKEGQLTAQAIDILVGARIHSIDDDLQANHGNVMVIRSRQCALVKQNMRKWVRVGDFFQENTVAENQGGITANIDRAGNPVDSRPANDDGSPLIHCPLQCLGVVPGARIRRKAKGRGIRKPMADHGASSRLWQRGFGGVQPSQWLQQQGGENGDNQIHTYFQALYPIWFTWKGLFGPRCDIPFIPSNSETTGIGGASAAESGSNCLTSAMLRKWCCFMIAFCFFYCSSLGELAFV